MFKKAVESIKIMLFVAHCRIRTIIDRFAYFGGKRAVVTDKGRAYADYLMKIYNDESYTYDDYTEMQYYNSLVKFCDKFEFDNIRDGAITMLGVMIPYLVTDDAE